MRNLVYSFAPLATAAAAAAGVILVRMASSFYLFEINFKQERMQRQQNIKQKKNYASNIIVQCRYKCKKYTLKCIPEYIWRLGT